MYVWQIVPGYMQIVVWKALKEINDDLLVYCLRRAVHLTCLTTTAVFRSEFAESLMPDIARKGYGWPTLPEYR